MMRSPIIREATVSVETTPGPKVVLVPAGAYFLEAKDTNGGTISVKRGAAAVFASGQTQFSRELPAVGNVQRVLPETYIQFSSGSGIVYAESDDAGFGSIWKSEDNKAIANVIGIAKV
jgi:hypothetical protein